jgi:hypothetical protein
MEVDIETNDKIKENNNEDSDYSYEEDESDLLTTTFVDLNNFDTKDNDYLIFGTFGNASGFLKVALYEELRKQPNAFKGKFMQGKASDKNSPKKLVAEVYQFKHDTQHSIVVLPKEQFNKQNYSFVSDFFISQNEKQSQVNFKRAIILDSKYYNEFIKEGEKDSLKEELFCIKNDTQQQVNQLIRCPEIPVFNGISGFSAYFIQKTNLFKIPAVYYCAAHTEYEVCLSNIKIFEKCAVTYPFFRNKLSEEKVANINVGLSALFKEFNSYKNSIYC